MFTNGAKNSPKGPSPEKAKSIKNLSMLWGFIFCSFNFVKAALIGLVTVSYGRKVDKSTTLNSPSSLGFVTAIKLEFLWNSGATYLLYLSIKSSLIPVTAPYIPFAAIDAPPRVTNWPINPLYPISLNTGSSVAISLKLVLILK